MKDSKDLDEGMNKVLARCDTTVVDKCKLNEQ